MNQNGQDIMNQKSQDIISSNTYIILKIYHSFPWEKEIRFLNNALLPVNLVSPPTNRWQRKGLLIYTRKNIAAMLEYCFNGAIDPFICSPLLIKSVFSVYRLLEGYQRIFYFAFENESWVSNILNLSNIKNIEDCICS